MKKRDCREIQGGIEEVRQVLHHSSFLCRSSLLPEMIKLARDNGLEAEWSSVLLSSPNSVPLHSTVVLTLEPREEATGWSLLDYL